jgi:chloramphenicol-sensitive protein RarD
LATLGLLQYLAPVMQFLIGVLIRHEPMPAARLAGFALVWIALTIFTVGALRHGRASAASRRPAEPEELTPALVSGRD